MLLHISHCAGGPQSRELSTQIVDFSAAGKAGNTGRARQAFNTRAQIFRTNTYYTVRFTEGNTEGSRGR